jgi:hypothetical protein
VRPKIVGGATVPDRLERMEGKRWLLGHFAGGTPVLDKPPFINLDNALTVERQGDLVVMMGGERSTLTPCRTRLLARCRSRGERNVRRMTLSCAIIFPDAQREDTARSSVTWQKQALYGEASKPTRIGHSPAGLPPALAEPWLEWGDRGNPGVGAVLLIPGAATFNAIRRASRSITEEGLLGTCGSAQPTWPR